MATRDLVIGVLFLSQTVFGIWGNCSLCYHYIFCYFTGCRVRSTGLILRHLTVANSLVITFKGVPQTMEAFGLEISLNDFACKLVLYVPRVGRGVSLGTTCLLSVVQAFTISPRNSRWGELKVQVLKCTGPYIILCWILYMLVNIIFPLYVTSKWNNKTITKEKDLGYCYGMWTNKSTQSLLAAVLTAPDVVCLGLMLWASISVVFTLYRHKQRVQYIHRNNISPRSSPETRAMQSTLVLVSTFISFYTLSSIFSVCLALSDHPSWWLLNITAMFALCFPSVSPFLLIHDARGLRLFSACCKRNTHFPKLFR
ncbi:vomeronasal type-1 receptor 4-like [Diceros bicornis minor]|uniref:vomeronasal type-1 receptor 4-like n=1 Tax=Diceros bicornis minor TaxID=77932 RepID=UPI0026F050BC|nr:vomeronasal type-1 receptor 4-like [Diceros bicornis minor]